MEWTNLKEKEPKKEGRYLVHIKQDNFTMVAEWRKDHDTEYYYFDNPGGMLPISTVVTHWMPIPTLKDAPKTITTHENQPIQDFARQVFKTVVEDWGSHNVDEFVEAFKKEVNK